MNNLPDIIRNGFFKRVWTFIRNVFIKETNIDDKDKININFNRQEINNNRNKIGFITEREKMDTLQKIKKLYQEREEKEKLYKTIKIVETNPKALEYMSINELKEIEQYYNGEILSIKKKLGN